MYFQRFGILTLNVEVSSTTQEYKEWIDQKFEDTLCPSSLQELIKWDDSIQKEDSVKRLETPVEWHYHTTILYIDVENPRYTPGKSLEGSRRYCRYGNNTFRQSIQGNEA